jgi:hypothetical protein
MVLVAVALLATAMPALENARTATTAERLDTEGERVERAVGGVVSGSVAVADRSLAARTTTTVRAPTGVTAAPIDRLALVDGGTLGPPERGGVALRYRLSDGPDRFVTVVPSTLGARVAVIDGPLALRTSGESRIELRYVDADGPTVEVSRVR